jgi:myo-inositol-1(or 4)-monophosphatase
MYLNTALVMAKEGGRILKSFWGSLKQVETKNNAIDLVTEADRTSEKALLGIVQSHYPDHAFLGEESGEWQQGQSDFLWVVDPLDGTTNFTHQYPMVAVSVALVVKGKPVVGVIYNPILEELFHATLNGGAFLNGNRIAVSQTTTLEKALLASGFAYDRRDNPDNNYSEFIRLTHLSQGVRRGGSAALDLSYVAAGRFDGYWERGLKPWDMAAGVLLVSEAGGVVSGYANAPFDLHGDNIVASNGKVHVALMSELNNAKQKPVII